MKQLTAKGILLEAYELQLEIQDNETTMRKITQDILKLNGQFALIRATITHKERKKARLILSAKSVLK